MCHSLEPKHKHPQDGVYTSIIPCILSIIHTNPCGEIKATVCNHHVDFLGLYIWLNDFAIKKTKLRPEVPFIKQFRRGIFSCARKKLALLDEMNPGVRSTVVERATYMRVYAGSSPTGADHRKEFISALSFSPNDVK